MISINMHNYTKNENKRGKQYITNEIQSLVFQFFFFLKRKFRIISNDFLSARCKYFVISKICANNYCNTY